MQWGTSDGGLELRVSEQLAELALLDRDGFEELGRLLMAKLNDVARVKRNHETS